MFGKKKEVEVSDAEVVQAYREQAKAIGRVRLPKRGTTKPLSQGKGKFARRQRLRLKYYKQLRDKRDRWLKGELTREEIQTAKKSFKEFKEAMRMVKKPAWLRGIEKILKPFRGGRYV